MKLNGFPLISRQMFSTLLILSLLCCRTSVAKHRNECVPLLMEVGGRQRSISVTFGRIDQGDRKSFEESIREAAKVTVDLEFPNDIKIEVLPSKENVSDINHIILWNSAITLTADFSRSPHEKLVPVFAHEFGHAVITKNFMKDLPELGSAYSKVFKRNRISELYNKNLAELAGPEAKFYPAKKVEILMDQMDRLDFLFGEIKISEREEKLIAFNIYFQEAFSDILAAAVHKRNAIGDALKNEMHFENLRDLESLNPKCWVSGNVHTALMPYASYAYKNYLMNGLYKDSDVVRNFYEAMRIFFERTIKEGEIFEHRGTNSSSRSASIYGQDTRAMNNVLIENFDRLMKRGP